jgi:hypothetical protein
MKETTTLRDVRHVSISIARPPSAVYAFASNPANAPAWASGLAGAINRVGSEWIAESPMGKIKIRFADQNAFGVLDHDVTLPSGLTIHNPMRVMANGDGSEVVFSLFHLPGVSDAKFADDAAWVMKDLQTLKRVLEQ